MKKKKKIKSSFQNLNANLKCTEWGENEIKDSINDDRKIDKSVLFRIQIKMSLQQSPATQRSVAKTHFPIKNQFPSFCRATDFFFRGTNCIQTNFTVLFLFANLFNPQYVIVEIEIGSSFFGKQKRIFLFYDFKFVYLLEKF